VPPGGSVGPLPPGSYGRVTVLGGGTLMLGPGVFEFCSLRTARRSRIEVTGPTQTEIDVTGTFRLADQSAMEEDPGTPIPVLNVAGKLVRASAESTLDAFVHAPNAKITFGRSSELFGAFCADTSGTDKHVTLFCPFTP